MGSFVKNRMRAYSESFEPTPEQQRRALVLNATKQARARFHAAISALNAAQAAYGTAVKHNSPPEDARAALTAWEQAVAGLVAVAMVLPPVAIQ